MRKRKSQFLLFALLLAGGTGVLHANESWLSIETFAGSGQDVKTELQDIQKITFADGNVNVFNQQGETLQSISIAAISKMQFVYNSGVEANIAQNGNIRVYPNPATDYVMVEGVKADDGETLAVYSLTGELMLSIDNWKGEAVNVSSLPKKIYILKVSNHYFKLAKQ